MNVFFFFFYEILIALKMHIINHEGLLILLALWWLMRTVNSFDLLAGRIGNEKIYYQGGCYGEICSRGDFYEGTYYEGD